MTKYIIKRLLCLIPVILGITLLIFFIMDMAPGDPAATILGDAANEESIALLREELGLNDPFFVRFFRYVFDALHGDFGRSYSTNVPVMEEIAVRFPVTLKLAVFGILLSLVVGIPIGIISAVRQYSLLDYSTMLFTLILTSMPGFWLGMLLLMLFSLKLGWFPATGAVGWISFVLPTITVASRSMANIARMTRTTMLEVLGQDYVRTARAKGIPEKVVVMSHALRNALIPIITIIGTQLAGVLGGSVLTETVFAWPGVGRLIVDSLNMRDTPLVTGSIIMTTILLSFVLLLVDLLYAAVDPRIKAQYTTSKRGKKKHE